MNFEKFDFLLKFESYSNTANRLETFGKWPHRKTSKCSAKKVRILFRVFVLRKEKYFQFWETKYYENTI